MCFLGIATTVHSSQQQCPVIPSVQSALSKGSEDGCTCNLDPESLGCRCLCESGAQ